MDFTVLPPEVNSARMYAGAGSGPFLAAAEAWTALSAGLHETAAGYRAVVSGLAASWLGPSSLAMQAAGASYAAWLTAAAAQADATAARAHAAVAAYETAFAATVPPEPVAANRGLLAALAASNLLGQNTAAIMATEAAYGEMWAQDAAAMIGYQTGSLQAATLQPFESAPNATSGVENLLGLLQSPSGIVQEILAKLGDSGSLLGQLNTYAQSFLSSGPYQMPTELLSLFSVLWGVNQGSNIFNRVNANALSGGTVVAAPGASVVVESPFPPTIGAAPRMGPPAVPPGWAQRATAPPPRPPVATPISGEPIPDAAIPAMPFMPVASTGKPATTDKPPPKYGTAIPTIMTRPPSGG